MTRQLATQTQQPTSTANLLSRGGILQRQCESCGQHTIAGGACAECGKKKSGLQRKLTIGASNDPLEQEADRVADQVMAAPSQPAVSDAPPRIQRFTGQMTEGMGTAPASVDRVLSSPGRPLDPAIQQDMGQRFGHDFSGVRVHTDAAAERSAREVNANAYTVGQNIVFGAGRYAPETHRGKQLIAHELTHVVQQRHVSTPAILPISSPNAVARQVLAGHKEGLQQFPSSALQLQRQPTFTVRPETVEIAGEKFPPPTTLTYGELEKFIDKLIEMWRKNTLDQLKIMTVLPSYVSQADKILSSSPIKVPGIIKPFEKPFKLFQIQMRPGEAEISYPPSVRDRLIKPTQAQEDAFAKQPAVKELALKENVSYRMHRWGPQFINGLKRSNLWAKVQASGSKIVENFNSLSTGASFYGGFTVGWPAGALQDIYKQAKSIALIAKDLFLLNLKSAIDKEQFIQELNQGLEKFQSGLPKMLDTLLNADELGFYVGEASAEELQQFINQSPFWQGYALGKIGGTIAMEVALLFIGVEEVSLVAKAIRGTKIGVEIAEAMAKSSATLKSILEARGVLTEARVLSKEGQALGEAGKAAKVADSATTQAAEKLSSKFQADAIKFVEEHPGNIHGETPGSRRASVTANGESHEIVEVLDSSLPSGIGCELQSPPPYPKIPCPKGMGSIEGKAAQDSRLVLSSGEELAARKKAIELQLTDLANKRYKLTKQGIAPRPEEPANVEYERLSKQIKQLEEELNTLRQLEQGIPTTLAERAKLFERVVTSKLREQGFQRVASQVELEVTLANGEKIIIIPDNVVEINGRYRIVDAKWTDAGDLRRGSNAGLTTNQRITYPAIANKQITKAILVDKKGASQLGRISGDTLELDSILEIYTNETSLSNWSTRGLQGGGIKTRKLIF